MSDESIIPQIKEELEDLSNWLVEKKLPGLEMKLFEPDPIKPSDFGNAERLIKKHGKDLHYCYQWKRWLWWDGIRWVKDETGEIWRRAKDTVRQIYVEASRTSDEKERKELGKHALRSESDVRIKAMIHQAESEPGIPVSPDELDQNPMLLNVLNGTVDLATGELLPHNRDFLLCKLAPVIYDSSAECPEWTKFLNRIMAGNQNLIDFLQLAVGYSLSGETKEQCLFFFYGTGANGKSTFLNTILTMLGDYALQTPMNTLLVKQGDSIPNDVARLKGARFVVAVEVEEGKRLAESLVKQLTGGDKITARFLHQEFFEFRPEFKIFIGTNHKPEIKGTDHGIWRRIRLVPFEVVIPPEEQDKTLPEKLKKEFPGILKWAIEGFIAWQKEGLFIPEEVTEATEEYRAEMDTLTGFFKESCIFDNQVKITAGLIYSEYCKWCNEMGEVSLNQKAFGLRLKEKGCNSIRIGKNRVRGWAGITLISIWNQADTFPRRTDADAI